MNFRQFLLSKRHDRRGQLAALATLTFTDKRFPWKPKPNGRPAREIQREYLIAKLQASSTLPMTCSNMLEAFDAVWSEFEKMYGKK